MTERQNEQHDRLIPGVEPDFDLGEPLDIDQETEKVSTAANHDIQSVVKSVDSETFIDVPTELKLEEPDEEVLDCLNCAAPLKGPYCHNCGQPDRHFIRFFPKVLWEMINEAFDLDSRAFRTLFPLMFSPGRLSMEYFAGRRARYVNPLRLYIILSVLFFISLSLVTSDDPEFTVSGDDGVQIRIRTDESNKGSADQELSSEQQEQKEKQAAKKKAGLLNDEGGLNVTLDNGKLWNVESNPFIFGGVFNEDITRDLNQFMWTMGLKLDKAIKEDPSELFDEFLNAIPQLMFILLPVFALLLKITYIFKKRYYMEHLIVALHNHCLLFFSLIILIFMSYLEDRFPDPEWLNDVISYLMVAILIWTPINLFIGMKRIYAQGYMMTTLKFIFIAVSYEILLTATAAIAFVVGLATL